MKNRSGLSVSFLDLMTCSLGAVLLLFFILAAVKEHFEYHRVTRPETETSDLEESPFVIVAYSKANEMLFSDPERQRWEVRPHDPNIHMFSGTNYAILLAAKTPSIATRIELVSLNPQAEFRWQVMDGSRLLPLVNDKAADDGRMKLWPKKMPERMAP